MSIESIAKTSGETLRESAVSTPAPHARPTKTRRAARPVPSTTLPEQRSPIPAGELVPGGDLAPKILGSRSGIRTVGCYGLADLFSIAIALGSIRFLLMLVGAEGPIAFADVRLAVGFTSAALIVNWYQGLYSTLSLKPAAELRQIACSGAGLALFFLSLLWMIDLPNPSAVAWLAMSSLVMAVLVPLMRAACRITFGKSSWWGRRVLLVGCGERSAQMYRALRKNAVYGLRPVGFVENFDLLSDDATGEGYLGPVAELRERVAEYNVSLGLVISNGMGPRSEIGQLVCRPSTGLTDWVLVSDCTSLPCLWTAAREVAGMPALGVANRLQSGWRRLIKRAFDLTIVLSASLLWLPLIGLLALIVRLTSPGKAFYSQTRIGVDGKLFQCWKLRSMVHNADEVLHDYLQKHPELQEEWDSDHKLKDDPRITLIGKIIRKTSLDELPQVWNIVRGDMSLVGPRPIVSAEIAKYGDVFEQYLLVIPGITGLWQVNGRNNTAYHERLALDDYYVRNWSLWLDIYIMLCTVKVVALREGAY